MIDQPNALELKPPTPLFFTVLANGQTQVLDVTTQTMEKNWPTDEKQKELTR